jgi:hypothetical protein
LHGVVFRESLKLRPPDAAAAFETATAAGATAGERKCFVKLSPADR